MYALLLAIIYVAFVSLGLPDSLIGAGWPVMHGELGVPTAFAGVVTMIIAGGTIVSSLLSDRLTRALGTGLITAISVVMTAVALIGFSTSTEFWMLCVWAIPYGLGAGAVDAALNNYVALHYSSRHMSWLHAFWGVGASISPFIMSYAISGGFGWTGGYRVVGFIQIALTAVLIMTVPLWRKVNPGISSDDGGAAAPRLTFRGALRIKGVPLMLVAFLSYCALESTAIIWAATYLVQDRGVDVATAAAFASFFLLGITAGRFLSGVIADRMGDRQLIRYGFVAIGVGAAMIALPLETNVLALAGLVLAGFGSAPVYPAIIHSTPVNFGRENSQAIIGIQMASAYTGSTLMPPLFGVLAAWIGMWIFPFFIAAFVVLGLAMTERLNRTVGAS